MLGEEDDHTVWPAVAVEVGQHLLRAVVAYAAAHAAAELLAPKRDTQGCGVGHAVVAADVTDFPALCGLEAVSAVQCHAVVGIHAVGQAVAVDVQERPYCEVGQVVLTSGMAVELCHHLRIRFLLL